ncbi:AraC family transcriptional regulator ligand-binding domain-containing protein [Streptomyces boninensis]|uniref:AraC family transcriptional regulator n=1 Tax=Streptomyces boninensis TaxID=2039455 RepID=UPI003B215D4F
MLIEAAVMAGLDRSQLACVPGVAGLGESPGRISTAAMLRIWEVIAAPMQGVGGSGEAMRLWRPGTLGVWDYLFHAADTLADALRDGARQFAVIADPNDEVVVVRDDEGVTVSWKGPHIDHPSYRQIAELVPAMFLTTAGSGAGRVLTPASVRLPHSAPARHGHLVDLYGTRRIDFGAGFPSVTFTEADADAPLPRADPALSAILNDHARITMATARPLQGWLDRFRAALQASVDSGHPDQGRVSHRLGMSPRTLQRRLREEGTSWREELGAYRQQRVDELLRETSLTLESIATRVGYSEPRALSRAIHRWYGRGPSAIRTAAQQRIP